MRLPRLLVPTVLLALFVPGAIAEVCGSSSGCEFWDNSYHEYVLYEEDTTKIDVLIIPPASPFALRDTTTAKLAVQGCKDGINAFGATWFKSAMNINAYVVGQDTIPQDALNDPEVVIVISEHDPVLLFGIGAEPKQMVVTCESFGQQTLQQFPGHAHDGAQVSSADCTGTGFMCFAVNTNFLLGGTYQMYDLIAHEFGHCLGTGHVGDALDFDAKTVPAYDVMSYMYRSSHVNCVSNMNVKVMEGIYGHLLGQPASNDLHPGDYYTMSSGYQQVNCANPARGILN